MSVAHIQKNITENPMRTFDIVENLLGFSLYKENITQNPMRGTFYIVEILLGLSPYIEMFHSKPSQSHLFFFTCTITSLARFSLSHLHSSHYYIILSMAHGSYCLILVRTCWVLVGSFVLLFWTSLP